MTTSNPKNIVVLGAGVIGLTTALKIQEEEGYNVTILAEQFPTDPKTVKYASLSAGAHHVSVAGADPAQRDIDLETFKTMWELSGPEASAEGCFIRLPQYEFHREETNHDTLGLMPNFAELPASSLVPNAVAGITYDSVNTDAPVFLDYLLARFLAAGGVIVRGSIVHIDQVLAGGAHAFTGSEPARGAAVPDAVIVCLGLGARLLGGVEDALVYPVRGQTVRIRAPWVQKCMSLSGGPSGIWTYIIPRRSGDVIIGGTYEANDWYSRPRPETTVDILTRVLEICPEIAPPEIRAERVPTIEDMYPIIVEENCGFRPCRKGGPRLELEWKESGTRKVPVIHNYGHGGFGYIACYGSASVAFNLLREAFRDAQ
ncbi:hypothetical protein HYPSUDRAFT_180414 [Hypholoma sublateritium FD-334 SS-4]|uniref:FAD dependent oxidoreductase domain-containing protein n=1 Tax=Hypholoma sublateritium (strain FD-334 SS-4) TaxID=945553 RepID=A0A0D2LGU4_HYPSF|nr:hypothetical protein HYPSUDRAFT_180414 [Hypholoma sublateritium FD-334 SS-4]